MASPGYSSVVKINLDIDEDPATSLATATLVRAPNVRTLGLGTTRYFGDSIFGLDALFDYNVSGVTYLDISRTEDEFDWEGILVAFTTLRSLGLDDSQVDLLLHVEIPSTVEVILLDYSNTTLTAFAASTQFSSDLDDKLKTRTFLPALKEIRFTHPNVTLAQLVGVDFIRAPLVRTCEARGIVLQVVPQPARASEDWI